MNILVWMLLSWITCQASFEHPENIPCFCLDERLIADLRLIGNQSFSPLEGFMNEKDYRSVMERTRLANGTLFPIPIVLPVPPDLAQKALDYGELLLQDDKLNPLAICEIEDAYEPDVEKEAQSVLGTLDTNHPSVGRILNRKGKCYLGCKIRPLPFLNKLDREEEVMTPAETKAFFREQNWNNVVAFQTRNPLHRAHVALIESCLDRAGVDATLFLQPVIGPTQDEDVEPRIRIKCYQALLKEFKNRKVFLTYLPLAMRMAGPKEALMHAIIRKNHGVNCFIIGRDHAGPSSKDKNGRPFYHPYAAHELVKSHAEELGLKILTSEEMVFVKETQSFIPENELTPGLTPLRVSGTEVRRKLRTGQELPGWFSYPDVVKILGNYFRSRNGLCVYLVGLSGAGKSTLSTLLKKRIEEIDPLQRPVTVLDGDVIRKNLSAGLGFSKQDRSLNVRRIGYAASLVVNSGGICICANIAPYEEDRLANRQLINAKGCYCEIFVDTPISICEERDVKGLYKLAREGKLKEFTGVSDPFEPPVFADIRIEGDKNPHECVEQIMTRLKEIYPFYSQL